jgi:hypothetical protein
VGPRSASEAVAIGRRLEELERPKAAARTGGRPSKETGGNLPPVSGGKVRDIVAPAVGLSGKTYERAKDVVAHAEKDQERFGDLKEQMDATGKVPSTRRASESFGGLGATGVQTSGWQSRNPVTQLTIPEGTF